MKQQLESGVTLIVDRYAFSGVAYTGAKGYDLERCKDPDRGLIAPDAVVRWNTTINFYLTLMLLHFP